MRPVNMYATRSALTEWAGQFYVNKVDGVSLDPRIESFGANTRLAIEVQRLGSYLTTIYAYGTTAIRNADAGRDVNVGSIVYGETNGPLAFWSGNAWTADGFSVAPELRSVLASLAVSTKGTADGATAAIGLYASLAIDALGRPVSYTLLDGSRWEAKQGVFVRILEAQSSSGAAVAGVGLFRTLTTDVTGRPIAYTLLDGSQWEARRGIMIRLLERSDAPVAAIPGLRLYSEIKVDGAGRPVSYTLLDGSKWEARSGVMVRTSSAAGAAPSYKFQRLTGRHLLDTSALAVGVDFMILLVGQSWAEGASFDADDATVTTTAQHPGAALMFNVGTNPDGRGVSSFVDLVEAPYLTSSKETSLSGMADVIMQRLNTDLGVKPRIVFAVAGRGGTAYYGGSAAADLGIKRGSENYKEAMRLVSEGSRISSAAGRRLVVLAVVVHHGEQDSSESLSTALYQRALDQFQRDQEEDFRAITGQSERIRMYVTQVNRATNSVVGPASDVALAQLASEDRNPMIRCVGPTYQSPPSSDHAHLKARGFRWVGCLDGHFIANDLFGPYEQALRVVDAWWVSSTVFRLRYSKPLAIEADDSRIVISPLGPGKGVAFLDGSGSPPTVSGISIASGATDTLEVTLSTAPTGKRPRAFIAAYRTEGGSGNTEGPRSGIRAASAFFTDALTSTDLFQWAAHETINLPII